MPHSGVLATILSGLEPSVAICLACIPLLRPLFYRKSSLESNSSGSGYENNKSSGLYFKKGSKSAHKDPTSTFSELYDDNDDSSQIQLQLQPLPEDTPVVNVSTEQDREANWPSASPSQMIRVKKTWEVSRN
ncbi:hypothetical protein J1614_006782 [Plenodomus biglobosus]|nr:hypothetical protein J1614_006782 [Plenodomus biglobosus]